MTVIGVAQSEIKHQSGSGAKQAVRALVIAFAQDPIGFCYKVTFLGGVVFGYGDSAGGCGCGDAVVGGQFSDEG